MPATLPPELDGDHVRLVELILLRGPMSLTERQFSLAVELLAGRIHDFLVPVLPFRAPTVTVGELGPRENYPVLEMAARRVYDCLVAIELSQPEPPEPE